MKRVRQKYVFLGFWVPLVIALCLNPGRNGINIPKFSVPSLALLAICGFFMIAFSAVAFVQPKVANLIFSDEEQNWFDKVKTLLWLLMGSICVYYAIFL